MSTIKLLTNTTDIEKAITSVSNRGKKWQKDVQVVALSALNHSIQHNDPIYINRLVEAMPNGSRNNSLRAWFEMFGNVEYNTESKMFVYSRARKDKHNLDGAIDTPWYEATKEAEYKPFNLDTEASRLCNKMIKAVGNKELDATVLTATMASMGYHMTDKQLQALAEAEAVTRATVPTTDDVMQLV